MYGKYKSPLGVIYFKVEHEHLTDLMIDDLHVETADDHHVVRYIVQQLAAYFDHHLEMFHLPIMFNKGTLFQKEVWNALLTIPYGSTSSYQDIANQIGRPKAVRAVGQACKKNPIGIVVPCHRVIGKDGSMRGYSGPLHIDLKQKLIDHEQKKTSDLGET